MGVFIGILGFLTFAVCLVISGLFLFKKNKPKAKKFACGIAVGIVVFIIWIAINPPPQESNKNKASTTTSSSEKSKGAATTNSNKNDSTSTNNKTAVSGEMKVHFINVGQADSILVQDGNKTMLIDAGNNDDDKTVINYIKSLGVSKLDVVVATHAHEDHIGGLDKVISTFDIGSVYMPKQTTNTKTYMDVISAIKAKQLKITAPISGSTIKLNQAEIFILAPNSEKYEDINNSSIAVRLTFGANSFLLMGDAEDLSEHEILSKGFNVSADVLKLGHHGSSSSTSIDFLNKSNVKYAVISVGQGNTYGHPHKETMSKLESKGIKVYRTDECGTIVATCDGKNISFNVKEGDYKAGSASSGSSSPSAPSTQPTPQASTPAPAASNDKIVYYVPNGKSYHFNKNCTTLKNSKTILEGKLSDIINMGKSNPCDKCAH